MATAGYEHELSANDRRVHYGDETLRNADGPLSHVENIHDLARLDALDEKTLLDVIKRRFHQRIIYVRFYHIFLKINNAIYPDTSGV